jgi:prepilin-type N-terminal cleavage/methylation domain-containing protein
LGLSGFVHVSQGSSFLATLGFEPESLWDSILESPSTWKVNASCAPEPGKDAFHRVPDFARNEWDAVERVPTALRGCRRAFSLIELIGVLAIISILAALMVPSVVKRVDLAAWSSESATLGAMADALKQSIVQSNSIPDTNQWYNVISTQLGLAPANVLTNSRGYRRAFLIDASGWLGSAPFNSGYWNQSPGGTTDQTPWATNGPIGCRLMIVSTIGGTDLPVSSGPLGPAAFSDIWNTAQGATPSTWSWNYTNDLVIQRINLDPLFHHVILINGALTLSGQGYFSINGSSPVPVPPGGAGTNTYYLDGSLLALYGIGTNLMAQEIIRGDLSRVFEYSIWRDQVYGGTTNGVLTGLDLLAATFFANAAPGSAPPGASPQGVLGMMTSYMNGYMSWAAMSPCFSYGGTNGIYTNGSFAPYNAIHGALTSAGVVP